MIDYTSIILYLSIGAIAGIVSGIIGIGGGVIIVPLLIMLAGLTQHKAQGTTLALLLPPIGALATWVYYKQGHVDFRIAVFICLGFLAGGFFGAKIAESVSEEALRKIFGMVLLLISLWMIFFKH